jgi:gluconolactonase
VSFAGRTQPTPLLDASAVQIFCDGFLTEPRLDHPECVAVNPADGSVWCGGEAGQLYRIEPDGSGLAEVHRTPSGFTLGIAFGPGGWLWFADLAQRTVSRLDPRSGMVERVAGPALPGGGELRIPNALAWDGGETMYLTDSWAADAPGPGVYRIRDGAIELWHAGPLTFANGIAVAPGGGAVYVAETHAHRVSRIAIEADGSAGARETVAELGDALPDGVAFGPDGLLYVACYEPSQLMRIEPSGEPRLLVHDTTAHVLAHPTNIAFREDLLLSANLGRWHVSAIDVALLRAA